jgi:hypothetical protein
MNVVTFRGIIERSDLPHQDFNLRVIDYVTAPGERVMDASGYVYTRQPASRYWFLPLGLRLMALRNLVPPYAATEMAAEPPAALLYSSRLFFWIQAWPSLAAFVSHHYMPLYRDIWIPAMSAAVPPNASVQWVVPRDGRYRIYASPVLLRHDWFSIPLMCGLMLPAEARKLTLDLRPFATDAGLAFTVDGKTIIPERDELVLRRKSILALHSAAPVPLGVMIVPNWTEKLFLRYPPLGSRGQ